jgi:serine/threonine-protein kinase
MELVVGLSLAQLLRSVFARGERVPAPIALELLAQAADGLHDAHEARSATGVPLGIVHRDISPQNVLVGIDGRVRLADFGVARAVMRITKTKTGQVKGKLGYFSPEQAMGHELDRRSDVFSLGIVAWELLAGRRLFRGKQLLDVYTKIVREDVEPIDQVVPHVPRALADAVMDALRRDPDARHPDAASFADALRAAARETGPLPDADAITEFVWQHGGEQVGTLVRAIERADAGPGRERTRAMLQLPRERDPLLDVPTDEQATVIRDRSEFGSDSETRTPFVMPPSTAAPARSGVFARISAWFARLLGG